MLLRILGIKKGRVWWGSIWLLFWGVWLLYRTSSLSSWSTSLLWFQKIMSKISGRLWRFTSIWEWVLRIGGRICKICCLRRWILTTASLLWWILMKVSVWVSWWKLKICHMWSCGWWRRYWLRTMWVYLVCGCCKSWVRWV